MPVRPESLSTSISVLQLLREHLLGESALEPDRVAEKLRQSMFWLGRGGSVEHAISGIDIALWDLCGKALGQPVSRLLGGNYRDRIKPYASILFDEPDRLREALRQQMARGFRAIKMGWRPFGRLGRYDGQSAFEPCAIRQDRFCHERRRNLPCQRIADTPALTRKAIRWIAELQIRKAV